MAHESLMAHVSLMMQESYDSVANNPLCHPYLNNNSKSVQTSLPLVYIIGIYDNQS